MYLREYQLQPHNFTKNEMETKVKGAVQSPKASNESHSDSNP